jgi:ribosomal-protein-alanine N-acetyltransferase
MSVEIVPAMIEDASTLAALHQACFAESWTAQSFASLMDSRGSFALVVRRGETPIGFILIRAVAGEGEILSIGVVPTERRAGLARSLISQAGERAHTEGAKALFLEVSTANTAARALYEGFGFRQVGMRKSYYREIGKVPEDAAVLKANLPL